MRYRSGTFSRPGYIRSPELTSRIKEVIEEEIGFEYVWVAGEVSNFRNNYTSGHWYFTLNDENSQISAVCFKWSNQRIKFLPENGMDVICAGQIGVYEKQGAYQINVRDIEPRGVGAQALALEQLKESSSPKASSTKPVSVSCPTSRSR
ncbi:MAG: exodeoxyribonuclease VII large subunit [Thermodesulfobacteriota bacterium]